MNKVICYPNCCIPDEFDERNWYFEMFSTPKVKRHNVGCIANNFFKELRKSMICPDEIALDFTMIAFGVVAADKAILRKKSADGWTRQIELTVYLHNVEKWNQVKAKFEWMLRFLSGDFWSLDFQQLPLSLVPVKKYDLKEQDCLCLLSGGMDSLVGAIDLYEQGRNPMFISQIVKGDAEHQREYASRFGIDNICQWSSFISKKGSSEQSTRSRSIIFFAFALLASCGIKSNTTGRKELYVPENGFISLNTPLDPLRIGSLSTKTTHPVYMKALQNIWNQVGVNIDLILPYRYMTKGEVLKQCKNQDLMKREIFGSTSCGKYQRHGYRHCGVCVPCMVRRASFLHAGIEDETEKGYCIEDLKNANSKDVAAAMLAVQQIKKKGINEFIKGTLCFADYNEKVEYMGVVERGIAEIEELLKEYDVF